MTGEDRDTRYEIMIYENYAGPVDQEDQQDQWNRAAASSAMFLFYKIKKWEIKIISNNHNRQQ